MLIRGATGGDAQGILSIYGPIIENSTISFETEIPSPESFSNRIENVVREFPWLIAELDGCIAGYAYAGAYRKREAYQWSVETSVYVNESFRRRGVAKSLYHVLFELLIEMGFVNAYAGITQPNVPSQKTHESFGFAFLGSYDKVGYKFGQWHDVIWLQKALRPHPQNPAKPLQWDTFKSTDAALKIMGAGGSP